MVKFFLILFLIFFSFTVLAFHPKTDQAIIQKVAEWGPRDALILFKDYHREFWAGFERGQREPTPTRQEILVLTDRVVEAINSQQSMPAIVREWGKLSAKVLRLSDLASGCECTFKDPRAAQDFPYLVLSKQQRIPVIFYGFDDAFFDGDRERLLRRLNRNQKEWVNLLLYDYARLEAHQTYRVFDDRSNAFGVASFSLNHAFTTVLHFWYYIWRHAGGRWGPLTPRNTPDKMWVVANGY